MDSPKEKANNYIIDVKKKNQVDVAVQDVPAVANNNVVSKYRGNVIYLCINIKATVFPIEVENLKREENSKEVKSKLSSEEPYLDSIENKI